MNAGLIRGDALRLPLRDSSVDLVVTSPPYFALRSYQDSGEHYDGQIGSEDTPAAFLAALWGVLDECWRVLRPTGSVFVNLGDKYAGSGGHNNDGISSSSTLSGGKDKLRATRRSAPDRYTQDRGGLRPKSLMLLPEQFRLGAVDPTFREWKTGQAGPQWIARATIVWDKPNGLPESVTDRVRRSHEDWVHLTKQGRYFAAVDEIREPHKEPLTAEQLAARLRAKKNSVIHGGNRGAGRSNGANVNTDDDLAGVTGSNPLGKLPGSVWTIPSEPLKVPDWLGVDHFAAYPQEWPRRIVLGWSPSGWCTACGQPRTAVVDKVRRFDGPGTSSSASSHRGPAAASNNPQSSVLAGEFSARAVTEATITGYACGCPDTSAPTRPAVVLDPFSGTGTTVMVARALGRYGVGVDLSADYLRLARWRIFDSGHAAKTIRRTNEAAQLSML